MAFMVLVLMFVSSDTSWYTLSLLYASLAFAVAATITGLQEEFLLDEMLRSYLDTFPWNPKSDLSPVAGHESRLYSAKTMRTISFVIDLQEKTFPHPDKLASVDKILKMVQGSKPCSSKMFIWQRSMMFLTYSWVLSVCGMVLHVLMAHKCSELEIDGSKVRDDWAMFEFVESY